MAWIVIGFLILINATFWWIKLITLANIALIIVLSVFFGYSIVALISYTAITILFLSIKYAIKLFRK